MQDLSSTPVRRLQRVSATIPISLMPEWEHSKTGHEAFTVDLSRTGARVRTTFVLSAGEKLGIVPWGDSGQTIPSRVVWVQRGYGSLLAGLEFLDTSLA